MANLNIFIICFLWHYIAKKVTSLLWAFYGRSRHRGRKQMHYLESWGNSESEPCFYAKTFVWKLDLVWTYLDPTSINQVGWRRKVKWPSPSIPRSKMNQKTCAAGRFVTLIFNDLLWTDIDLFKYDLRTSTVSFQDTYQRFGWVWDLCSLSMSNTPQGPKYEKAFLFLTWSWPGTWLPS